MARSKELIAKILKSREEKNKNLIHASFEMETSTHFPLLMKLVNKTEGTIIELGSGLFSTPLLHWMCFENKRSLITIERHDHYFQFAKKFITDTHAVLNIKEVEKSDVIDGQNRYSIVFIDHSPKKPRTRGADALLFKDIADYIIMHDAGDDERIKYGYQQLYPHFKYRFDWKGAVPHTTILSNVDNLEWLKN